MGDLSVFKITEPAVISFSGGRTSAYMLYQILQAYNGKLPDDLIVCFANTGKEMPQTLDFVQACSENWNVKIHWLELRVVGKKFTTVEVDYKTASRDGRPFAEMIEKKNYLPNAIARFCTSELKVNRIGEFVGDGYSTILGIRADEERRLSKMRKRPEVIVPLADAKVTKHDIYNFWNNNSFDLQLPNEKGVNNLGNCDLCFLKGTGIKKSIIRDMPELAEWWIAQEEKIGGKFRSDQPDYKTMLISTDAQTNMFDQSIPCFCGD